jgi:hypothetical protein
MHQYDFFKQLSYRKYFQKMNLFNRLKSVPTEKNESRVPTPFALLLLLPFFSHDSYIQLI